MGFFVALAALITILARLVMIALVLAAMVGTVVGVIQFAVLQRMWDLFTAAIINTVKFTIAAGVMTLILGAIQTAPVGIGWRLLFAIVATVIAIMITKPIQSFKSMAGLDPTRSYLSSLLRRAGGTALGVVAGNRLSQRDDAGRGARRRHGPGRVRRQLHRAAGRALHAPAALAACGAGHRVRVGRGDRLGRSRAAVRGLSPAGPGGGSPDQRPNRSAPARTRCRRTPRWSRHRKIRDEAPRPVTVVPIVAGVDIRRPVMAEQTTCPAPRSRPADPGRSGWAAGPARTDAPDTAAHRRRDRRGGHLAGRRRPRVSPADPPPVVRTVEPAAVYPTGIVVQNEPGVYRSGGQLKVEEYVRFPEPQVDANGEETWTPLYHAKAKAR